MDAPPATRWSRYGLRGDPFFIDPLEPDENALYPITLFQGREDELAQLTALVHDSDRSATLVYADGGYGKTTLANRLAHDLDQQGLLVPPEEIQLSPEDPTFRFFRDLLAGILQALRDKGPALPKPPADPARDGEGDFPGLVRAQTFVQTVRRFAAAQVGFTLPGGAGLGGGFQHALMQPAYEPAASRHILRQVAQEVATLGFGGIVVRLNNMDHVAREAPAALTRFLGEARDLLQVPGIHYVMMGDAATLASIESVPRVRGCFGLPVPLPAFTAEQVVGLLEARYRLLAADGPVVPPASEELVQALHRIHHGDLRNILCDLQRTLQSLKAAIEPEPAVVADAVPVLSSLYHRILDDRLNDDQWVTLVRIYSEGPLRQVDLVGEGGIAGSPATVNERFRRLEDAGAIEVDRREGRSKYYRLTGAGKLGLFPWCLEHDTPKINSAFLQIVGELSEMPGPQ